MEAGVVKWFNNDKGFGFIVKEGDEKNDIFVHYSVIEMEGFRSLRAGQKVNFTLAEGERGLTASLVKPIITK